MRTVQVNTECQRHGPSPRQAELFRSLPSKYLAPMPGAGGSNIPATQRATRGTSRSTAAAPATQQNTRATPRAIAAAINGPGMSTGPGIQYYDPARSKFDSAKYNTRPERMAAPPQGPGTSDYRRGVGGYTMPDVYHYQADQSSNKSAKYSKQPDGKDVYPKKKK